MISTSFLFIPDIVAMLVLMGILNTLRRNGNPKDAGLWLVGLSLVLLEALSADAYHANISFLHEASHVTALAAFVLAGLTFAWVGRRDTLPRALYGSLCLVISLPLLLLTLVYGFDGHSEMVYEVTIGAGLFALLCWIALMLRSNLMVILATLLGVVGWAPLFYFASHHLFRPCVYWGVGCLYVLVAVALSSILGRSRVGGLVVVGGFVVWAGCLFAHPFVETGTVAYDFVQQVWTMQKFFVTIGLVLVLLDEERQRNRELALYDVLTGLPNRRLFDDRLSQAVERTKRSRNGFALFMIDLDNFKQINDQQGHAQGDMELRHAAVALASVVRSSDTLARFGGDEFSVLVNDISDPRRCGIISDQLRASLAHIDLSGSVGFALFPTDATDCVQLQELADRRMYQQKDSGPMLVPALPPARRA